VHDPGHAAGPSHDRRAPSALLPTFRAPTWPTWGNPLGEPLPGLIAEGLDALLAYLRSLAGPPRPPATNRAGQPGVTGYNLAAVCLSGFFVLYARETLHVPVAVYGLLAAAAPAAIAAGLRPELLTRRLSGRRVVAVCCLAQAAGWAVLAAFPAIWAAVLGMVVLGAANMWASVALSTACQTLTPAGILGAVSAACLTLVVGGAGLSALAGGLAGKLAGLNAAVILAAAIAAVAAIAIAPARATANRRRDADRHH
jgi:Transmembrane secretion effector